jgi:hypothetical protein
MSAENHTTHYIYFIQSGEGGPIKIGRTRYDPIRRLKGMQTGSHETLHLRRVIPSPGEHGEKAIHALFATARIRGEWFWPTKEVLAFIERPFVLPAPPSDPSAVPPRMPPKGLRTARQRERFKLYLVIAQLYQDGWSKKRIARSLDLHPNQVRRALRLCHELVDAG